MLPNERNLGLIETLNLGLDLCRGDYVARMDADDIAMPNRLELQHRFLQQHVKVILVGSFRIAIDEHDDPVQSYNRPATEAPLIRWKLLTGNFITHPSVMFRKTALRGPFFEERYKHSEDYAAWLKLSTLGDFAILPEPLLKVRFHSQSVSHCLGALASPGPAPGLGSRGYFNVFLHQRACPSIVYSSLGPLGFPRYSGHCRAIGGLPRVQRTLPSYDPSLGGIV